MSLYFLFQRDDDEEESNETEEKESEEETLPKPEARTSAESQDIYDDNLAVESDKNELFQTIRLTPDREIGTKRPKKEIKGFNPSKEGPTHDQLDAYYARYGTGKPNKKRHDAKSDANFGVSVDFAGHLSDNPLYIDVVPDHVLNSGYSVTSGLKPETYRTQWTSSPGQRPPLLNAAEEKDKFITRLKKQSYYPSEAHSKFIAAGKKPEVVAFDPYLDTQNAPHEPEEKSGSSSSSETPVYYVKETSSAPIPITLHKQYIPKTHAETTTYKVPINPVGEKSLLYLSPDGPSMPVLSR